MLNFSLKYNLHFSSVSFLKLLKYHLNNIYLNEDYYFKAAMNSNNKRLENELLKIIESKI